RTTTNPQAGVWEVAVEVRRTSDNVAVPYTLTTSILGASITPNPDVIPSAAPGVPVARSYTATNNLGPFTGRVATTGALGSAKISTPNIANLAQQVFDVTVTAGSTSLRATIGGTSDKAADLDLFVYRPTPSGYELAGQAADGDSEESVTISVTTAATYTILVDGFAVPAGSTTYNYVDVFTNASLGTVTVTDANAVRDSGAVWTAPATVTAGSVPTEGRVLLGSVRVLTNSGVQVGSGDVIVQTVTP
ncbi:MAG TPA: pre-peptidase C-terminal domain-containing protein, partial [Lapillicoccus sp.]|nr:pre-peptidase C-terminal domain-containing protein [Lapillicoccus sp.]